MRSVWVGLVGGGWAGDVAVFEAVAVAFEGEDFGVVNEAVNHRAVGHFVAEDVVPGRECLVGVTIRLARS